MTQGYIIDGYNGGVVIGNYCNFGASNLKKPSSRIKLIPDLQYEYKENNETNSVLWEISIDGVYEDVIIGNSYYYLEEYIELHSERLELNAYYQYNEDEDGNFVDSFVMIQNLSPNSRFIRLSPFDPFPNSMTFKENDTAEIDEYGGFTFELASYKSENKDPDEDDNEGDEQEEDPNYISDYEISQIMQGGSLTLMMKSSEFEFYVEGSNNYRMVIEYNDGYILTAKGMNHKVQISDVDKTQPVRIWIDNPVNLISIINVAAVSSWLSNGSRNYQFQYFASPTEYTYGNQVPNYLDPYTTSLQGMFGNSNFNDPNVVNWDVSSVTNLAGAFEFNVEFNQPIGNWNVSNVITASGMLQGASTFNQPLDEWQLINAINLDAMLNNARSFNQNLSYWCVPKITSSPFVFSQLPYDYLPKWGTCPVKVREPDYKPFTFIANSPINTVRVEPKYSTPLSVIIDWGNGDLIQYENVNGVLENNQVEEDAEIKVWLGDYVKFLQIGDTKAVIRWGDMHFDRLQFLGFASPDRYQYNQIPTYEPSNLKSAEGMFENTNFNGDINRWDLSNVTTTARMFKGARLFNGNVNALDFRNCTSFESMFEGATSFNQDIGFWRVGSIRNFDKMFKGATSFNQDISGWNTTQSTSMNNMFEEATSFDQDLSAWCVTNIKSRPFNFYSIYNPEREPTWGACPVKSNRFTTDIEFDYKDAQSMVVYNDGYYDVRVDFGDGVVKTVQPKKTEMSPTTLRGTGVKDVIISCEGSQGFTFSNVGIIGVKKWTDQGYSKLRFNCGNLVSVPDKAPPLYDFTNLFLECYKLNDPNISKWNISGTISLEGMFYNAQSFNQDLSNWDVSNVQSFKNMFKGAKAFNGDVGTWNTSSATNMTSMFEEATSFNKDLSNWNVENVTTMSSMFSAAHSFNQNLDKWNVSNCGDMSNMFSFALAFNGDIQNWDVRNVVLMGGMFNGAAVFNQELKSWCVSNIKSQPNSFSNNSPIHNTEYLPTWGTCPARPTKFTTVITAEELSTTSTLVVYNNDDNPVEVTSSANNEVVTIGKFETRTIKNLYGLGKVKVYINSTGTQDIEISGNALLSVDQWSAYGYKGIQLSGKNLTTVPNKAPDTSNFRKLFYGCSNFNDSNVTGWDTSKVTSMENTFGSNSIFNQDISGWDTSSVTNFSSMFGLAKKFNQPIGNWDTSSARNMSFMFDQATSFSQDLNKWDTSKVTTFKGMFRNSNNFKGDISQWDVSSATNMDEMLKNSYNASDLSGWCVSNFSSMPTYFDLNSPIVSPVWGTCPAK